jgi:hypothetical protein
MMTVVNPCLIRLHENLCAGKTLICTAAPPIKSEIALIIVDVINDLDFPEAKQLARFIPDLAEKIARLKRRAKAAKVPVIYVNDNFGRWRSDFRALIEHCRKGKARLLIEKLYPEQEDYFVLKPKHSGFFSSTLETLLRYLGVRRLIITGIAGNPDAVSRSWGRIQRSLDQSGSFEEDRRAAAEDCAQRAALARCQPKSYFSRKWRSISLLARAWKGQAKQRGAAEGSQGLRRGSDGSSPYRPVKNSCFRSNRSRTRLS